jgi:sulfur relay (sulfurtransferase) complex TusBCD TusD component (DsrE family)
VEPSDLAIIITTSPIRNNPATDVIDMAIASIHQEPSLALVPIFIICDGVKVTEEGGNKWKSGIVSENSNQQYEEFKLRLKEKYHSDQRIVVEQRSERCGFA